MSWLARLDVDAEVVHEAGISGDIYAWHKMLWGCYPNVPEKSRKDLGFLTRIDQLEGAYRLWVLSKSEPKRPDWCPEGSFALKEISSTFLSHRYYAFDLRANPVKAQVQRDEQGQPLLTESGKRKRGKRVPLVKLDELKSWLVRKGQARCLNMETKEDVPGGFRIVEERPLEISPMVESHFRKKEQSAYHGGVQFRGVLEVTNTKDFSETYYAGIGSAKGFGFGLLLLAPVKL